MRFILFNITFIFCLVIFQLIIKLDDKQTSFHIITILGSLTFIAIYLRYKKDKINISLPKFRLLLKVLLFYVLAAIIVAIWTLVFPLQEQVASSFIANQLILPLISIGLLIPIVEELMFRHCLMPYFTKKYTIHQCCLISSVIFALFHLELVNFFALFVLSYFISYSYLKYKNFFYPVFLHALNNSLAVVSFYYYPAI